VERNRKGKGKEKRKYGPPHNTGFGLEDMETCEWMLSAFNGLAPVTQYPSPFHHHQEINMFVCQWDNDTVSMKSCVHQFQRPLLQHINIFFLSKVSPKQLQASLAASRRTSIGNRSTSVWQISK